MFLQVFLLLEIYICDDDYDDDDDDDDDDDGEEDIYLCYHENAQNRIPAITMAGQKILTQARTARNEKR